MARNGFLARVAVVIDGPGDEFLAGAAFAQDQHGYILRGDPADRLIDRLHRRAAADQGVGRLVGLVLLPK